jgi:type II secretory pathway component PulF
MMTMVVPKLLDIFDDKASLPASTKILMATSDIFRDYWFVMIIFLIALFIAVLLWKKTPDGKYIFDNFLLKIPIF